MLAKSLSFLAGRGCRRDRARREGSDHPDQPGRRGDGAACVLRGRPAAGGGPARGRLSGDPIRTRRQMPNQIAVINAGSSSIKFAIFNDDPGQSLHLPRADRKDRRRAHSCRSKDPDGETLVENEWGAKELDHKSATKVILQTSIALLGGEAVEAIGHRVVHGGTQFTAPTRVTEGYHRLAEDAEPARAAAPAAQSRADRGDHGRSAAYPQVACFDTAFHQTQPQLAQTFALPRELTDSGIRRYGFHGLSYEFVSDRLRTVAPDSRAEAHHHRPSRQWRKPVRAFTRAQRRDDHGIHRRRRPDDGHALRIDRPGRAHLSDGRNEAGRARARRSDLQEIGLARRLRDFVRHAHLARIERSERAREAIEPVHLSDRARDRLACGGAWRAGRDRVHRRDWSARRQDPAGGRRRLRLARRGGRRPGECNRRRPDRRADLQNSDLGSRHR